MAAEARRSERVLCNPLLAADAFTGTPNNPRWQEWLCCARLWQRVILAACADVAELPRAQAGLLQVPQITLVGGGAPIRINGEVIGAIGVGGTPSGQTDEDIATAGASVIS